MKFLVSLYLFCFAFIDVGIAAILPVKSIKIRHVKEGTPFRSDKNAKSLADIINPQLGPNEDLDLAFIMDTTGSMGSYIKTAKDNIRQIVDEIVTASSVNIRLALIEYRDHKKQDKTFVTRLNDFTSSVSTMKLWLDNARAKGGGDKPEAVAEAMFDTTKLSWRPDATKIAVMISDAPPHGLVPAEDRSYPDGSPNQHDPIKIAEKFAQMGVTLYAIGCEPAIYDYKDFFEALAYITGGQYVPLTEPHLLVNAITGGAQEELSLKKFDGLVQAEVQKAVKRTGNGAPVDKDRIASDIFEKLKAAGAKTKQLRQNDKVLKGPSKEAKKLAELKSLAEVRKQFKKRPKILSGVSDLSSFRRLSGFRLPSWRRKVFSKKGLRTSFSDSPLLHAPSFARGASFPDLESIKSTSPKEKLSAVESDITLDQVKRMVQKVSTTVL